MDCMICGTRTEQTGEWEWVELPEPIELRSILDPDGPPTIVASTTGRICPTCTAWRPDARTAPLPDALERLIKAQVDLLVTVVDNEDLRHALTSQQVGTYRHIARQLKTMGQS
jgi:hypothetical protein